MKDTFENIFIPEAVHEEIMKGKEFGSADVPVIESAINDSWIRISKIRSTDADLPAILGAGEKQAIVLAIQKRREVDWLLMDDEIAAKTARSMGLSVRPASYLPIYWARKGAIKPLGALQMLDDLVQEGYGLNTRDYVVIKEQIENCS